MEKQLYDIECYRNYFCVGIKNYVTKEIVFYEISEVKDDRKEIYEWFKNFKGFLISFNGIHYDNMMVKYFIINYEKYKHLSFGNVTSDLKYFSDKIIHGDNDDEELRMIKYTKTQWIDIDLFLYWSQGLRLSKKISLKSLGIQLGYPTVQELPFKPDTILQQKDLPKLRYYNYTHDLGILELLCDEMEDEIKLRVDVLNKYNIQCLSWDAPKVASEALLQDYCKLTNKNVYATRKLKFEKPTLYLRDCLKGFDPGFKLPVFKKLWEDVLNSTNSYNETILVSHNNTNLRLTFGIGGLHAVNKNETYVTNREMKVLTSDIASLYPNLIINYMCIRFPEVLERYKQVKIERLVAKKAKDKATDKFLKLILNSTSGLLDQEHSWLYYPEGAMRLRLIGQLFLTKCIEVCVINKWQVVSANTDGIEVVIPSHNVKQYKEIMDMVANKFNLDFEHENYSKIIYKNVNNYLAVTDVGSIKRKGFFKLDYNEYKQREIPLGDSCNELIISKALNAYYVKGIEPREFISNPEKYNTTIYDYCKSNKIDRTFVVYHNGKIVQNLNRYYFGINKPYLFKRKNNEGTFQHINVGQGVVLFNDYVEKPFIEYEVNYAYYISATQKIIDEINNYNQLKLF